MQSSFNELSTSLPDSAKCEQTKLDTYTLIPELTLSRSLCWGVCHHPDSKVRRVSILALNVSRI